MSISGGHGTFADVGHGLADWVACGQHSIEPVTSARARWALIDLLGCAIAGHDSAAVTAAKTAAHRLGTGNVSALGAAGRYVAPFAALIGGTSSHVLDYDDTGATSIAHVSTVAVPAILSLAEQEYCSLDAVLEAYIVGFDVTMRIGRMLNPEHYAAGWYATATAGLIGATASCARLLKLDYPTTLAALSIASNLAGGSRRQIGSSMKATQAGVAAQNAVLAVRLAEAGTRGSTEPFHGEGGWVSLMSAPSQELRASRALAELGQGYALDGPELIQKFFPCCASAHKTLDAVLELMASNGFSAPDVDRIDTWLTPTQRRNLRFDQPINPVQARFSLPYCVSRLIHQGTLTLGDFTIDRVGDTTMRKIMGRIHIHLQDALHEPESHVSMLEMTAPLRTTVRLNDGTVLEKVIGAPKGNPINPMSEEERSSKFVECCNFASLNTDGRAVLDLIVALFAGNAMTPELTTYLSALIAQSSTD